jgi:hypothetical protein
MEYTPELSKEGGGNTYYGFTIQESDICSELRDMVISENIEFEYDEVDMDYLRIGNVITLNYGKSNTKSPYYVHTILQYEIEQKDYYEIFLSPFDKRAYNARVIVRGQEPDTHIFINNTEINDFIINIGGSPSGKSLDSTQRILRGFYPVPDSILCKYFDIGKDKILHHII